jgi:hypothetical protein
MKPMNTHRQLQVKLLLGWAAILLGVGDLQAATTNTVAALTNAPVTLSTNDFKSVFDSKGRDPFFPNSTRQSLEPSEKGDSQPVIVLMVKGFSGYGNHRMAIINDHTFMVGEESEVISAGGRIRIRCVEIRDDVAVVTIGNAPQRIELRIPSRF